MAVTAHGGTFTFVSNIGTFSGRVTNVKVETPSAEIVDMTALDAPADHIVLVPTGAWKGGSISVDYMTGSSGARAESLVKGYGSLSYASPGYSVTLQVVLESASTMLAIGDSVKGSMKFVPTDYYG